ncbi:MAG: PAS domain-containing protein [Alphaproteobacteria bacterium]
MIGKLVSKKSLIAENERLNKEIIEIEQNNKSIMDSSPICTKIIDLNYNLQFMSESGVKALDIDDIEEYYGRPYPLEFYSNSFKNDMKLSIKKCHETHETVVHEADIIDLNGNTLWFHSTIVPVDNEEGEIDHFLVFSIDITRFKK